MIGRSILLVAAVCGFAAIAVPSEHAMDSPALNAVSADETGDVNSDWYAGGHTLSRRGDGHFYASASIDGASIEMMVDTGASVIALTGDDAIAAGLDWDEEEVRHIGSGASGAVHGVPVTLEEVEIGGLVKRNVRAVIIPEGLDISLLGQSYLSQINNVEISGNEMILGS